MRAKLVEKLRSEIEEVVMTAEHLKNTHLHLPEVKLAVNLVLALNGLDPLLQKAVDHLRREGGQMEFVDETERSTQTQREMLSVET